MDFNDIKNLQLISEDGTVIDFSNNTTIEIKDEPELIFDNHNTIVGFHERERKAIITVRPDENGVLFSMNNKGKEKKKMTNYSIVWCRFARPDGTFDIDKGKLYKYLIAAPPERSNIQIGTVFKIMRNGYEQYNGTKLRCEEIEGYNSIDDINFVHGMLNSIEEIKIFYSYPHTEPVKVKKTVIGRELKVLYYDGKTPKEYFNEQFLKNCESYDGQIISSVSPVSLYRDNIISEVVATLENDRLIRTYDNSISLNDNTECQTILTTNAPLAVESSDVLTIGGNDMNTNMFGNVMKNMKFGKVDTKDIKYSFKGIAFRTADNDYVCYNPDFTFTNVGNMTIDMPIFAIPVCRDKIEVGDVILHNDQWVIVNDISESEIKVAKPWNKEVAYVIPETSIFGFSYYTKVLNMFESFGNAADSDNPFGNMLPFMLMSQSGDTKNDMTTMMMLMTMNGGEMNFDNPLMMMMLMGGDTKIDPMMMMFMMNNGMFGKQCNCRGKRTELHQVNELTQEEIAKLMADLEKSFTTVIPLEEE